MAKSQQTFNKLEKEKKRLKKREDKRKKMLARKEAKANGEYQVNEFVYVDYNGKFTDTPPDPAEKEKISAENIVIGIPKSANVKKDGYTGKVSFFDHSKGFGFIVDPETQEQFFVHISECIDEIKEGDANPDADDEDKELFVLLEFITLLLGRVWRRMFWYGRFF